MAAICKKEKVVSREREDERKRKNGNAPLSPSFKKSEGKKKTKKLLSHLSRFVGERRSDDPPRPLGCPPALGRRLQRLFEPLEPRRLHRLGRFVLPPEGPELLSVPLGFLFRGSGGALVLSGCCLERRRLLFCRLLPL